MPYQTMPDIGSKGPSKADTPWKRGLLNRIDELPWGDKTVAAAINEYGDYIDTNRSSQRWAWTVQWVENILFYSGRHYTDDILVNRLATDGSADDSGLSTIVRDTIENIPKPINDFLGRYIETNVALLTENRPIPRVTAKTEDIRDQKAAELSELTLQYLWEALDMPAKHREIARLVLNVGVCWLEIFYDPITPRRMKVPQTVTEPKSLIPGPDGAPPISVPIPRTVTKTDAEGRPVFEDTVEYGDMSAKIVTPFEMHVPSVHWWNGDDMGWVMREYYISIEEFVNNLTLAAKKKDSPVKKKNGWFLENLKTVQSENITKLPLWWWERLSALVEGPGPSLYIGTPEQWDGYTTVRIFDRKPSIEWPRGRTVIVAGKEVIYDSPKKVGARAYNPRWPTRWHPYVRYRWEAMIGCQIFDTPISLADGTVKPIQNISIGDKVASKYGIEKVTNKFEYEENKNVEEVRVNGCLPLKITGYHRLPVIKGSTFLDKVKPRSTRRYDYSRLSSKDIVELSVSELKKGDYILTSYLREQKNNYKIKVSDYYTPPPHPGNVNLPHSAIKYISPEIPIDQDFLRLLGLYLAEGSQSKRGIKFSYSTKEKDTLVKETQDLIKKVFGLDTYTTEEGGGINVHCTVGSVKALFTTLVGGKASEKKIHEDIFHAPVSLLPLVGGWIDGDGNSQKHKGKDHFTSRSSTASENLAFQISNILLDEKIPSVLSKRKNNKFNNYKEKSGDLFTLVWDTQARRDLALYCNKFKEDTAKKTARQGFWLDNFFCRKIKSIKTIPYKGKVYDLEVEKDHHYQANGVIVHNSIYGRALTSKLLPKLKRINAIDTTMIMWRRTVPISAWIVPKGSHPVNDIWTGRPGMIWEYDPRQTAQKAPEPVFPPDYPAGAIKEREMQLAEMEAIAGTEEILRGQRPTGVNSAMMVDILRKQALASRSAILQSWDESLQEGGTMILQAVIENVRNDPRYLERLRILAREKASRLTIERFSGEDLSDNVIVRVDTASMALVSKEAREAKMMELLQYGPALSAMPQGVRQAILDELGLKSALMPQGVDVERARRLIGWIKAKDFRRVIPFPEDDPYVFYELLVKEIKSDGFWDLDEQQQALMFALSDKYKQEIEFREVQAMKMQQAMAQAGVAPPPSPGGEGQQ